MLFTVHHRPPPRINVDIIQVLLNCVTATSSTARSYSWGRSIAHFSSISESTLTNWRQKSANMLSYHMRNAAIYQCLGQIITVNRLIYTSLFTIIMVAQKEKKKIYSQRLKTRAIINHILKLTVAWLPQRINQLVDKLHDIVKLQTIDARRAIRG